MKNNIIKQSKSQTEAKLAFHYMKTLAEISREAFLILSPSFRVILANPIFYKTFMVSPRQTENKTLYHLGNDQWNIPELKILLEEILPQKKVVVDFEVSHVFETIGQKTILLNARQIDSSKLIILCLEDISVRKVLEEQLAKHTETLAAEVKKQTAELTKRLEELESLNKTMVGREVKMVEMKKEIVELKKRVKNCNNNHKNGSN